MLDEPRGAARPGPVRELDAQAGFVRVQEDERVHSRAKLGGWPARAQQPAPRARPAGDCLTPGAGRVNCCQVSACIARPIRGLLPEPAYLLLEDGRRFEGERLGAAGAALGEVVFNTSMTGYQEVLTDPSYAGQIVVMTYPLIGNYGVNREDEEAAGPQVAGFIVREAARLHSNWRAQDSLEAYLEGHGVIGLSGVDTRALTRHLRSAGAMRAGVAPAEAPEAEVLARVLAHPRMEGLDLTGQVSTAEPYEVSPVGEPRFHVLAYDLGIKRNSLRLLAERGCRITTLPAHTTAGAVADEKPDGLFLSNGPGDPDAVGHA
ncbi:MAG: carbamoyl phosphate synthase small subunit, partial [Gemmatimonadetes bacterium]|nr:carbamoyl phosphate synthase small subunit [Gemmatimonadota bacterium]